MEHRAPVSDLLEELRSGLSNYWRHADAILQQSDVKLKAPDKEDFSFQRNFFSILFLYSFYRAKIPKHRRMLYAGIIQCLRGMVTGCDNLLDDEYKKTLDSDLPETAFRFRSVIDIMVSDRVLFQLLVEAGRGKDIGVEKIMAAAAASMKTMTRSGTQEASEEAGITEILKPDDLLQTVHHYKTGLLFQCPWDIPLVIEDLEGSEVAPLLEALYRIGMGCQILDDIVDFMSDLARKHHNYLVSLIYYSANPKEKSRLEELFASRERQCLPDDSAAGFPDNLAVACKTSRRFLESGLNLLFPAQHQFFVAPTIQFLENRIGAAQMMSASKK